MPGARRRGGPCLQTLSGKPPSPRTTVPAEPPSGGRVFRPETRCVSRNLSSPFPFMRFSFIKNERPSQVRVGSGGFPGWLRLRAPSAGAPGSTPCQGTRICRLQWGLMMLRATPSRGPAKASKHTETRYFKKSVAGGQETVKHSKGSQSRSLAVVKAPSCCAWGSPPTAQPADCSGATWHSPCCRGAWGSSYWRL